MRSDIRGILGASKAVMSGQASLARPGTGSVIITTLCYMLLTEAQTMHAYPVKQAHETGYKHVATLSDSSAIVGKASWYGPTSARYRTATGERFDPRQLTAASTQLPLGSHAMVTNLENGRSVSVRINDCGPYVKNRNLDLSRQAAETLGMVHKGAAPVRINVVNVPPDPSYCPRSTRLKAHRHSGHRQLPNSPRSRFAQVSKSSRSRPISHETVSFDSAARKRPSRPYLRSTATTRATSR
jgi:rare lipoprotein A